MSRQYTSHVMMVRPASFQFNAETAESNAFQKNMDEFSPENIKAKAIEEFDAFVEKLRANKIDVTVIEDTVEPPKPDAIFPNNWISMHADGSVYLYPMNTQNRRLERRDDILNKLEDQFQVKHIIDISDSEHAGHFLEGTGSIIFDHLNKVGYACISPRTDKDLFIAHCEQLGYAHIYFHSTDKNGDPVYHTNVMMTIGKGFAVICLETIRDEEERKIVVEKLQSTGHEIVDITEEQMNEFAGNMLEVENREGQPFLIMSESAFNSLTETQIAQIEKYTAILMVSIPTIETIGGGSARCMLAEIFLEKNSQVYGILKHFVSQ